jgi:hypothetical protein
MGASVSVDKYGAEPAPRSINRIFCEENIICGADLIDLSWAN